MTQLSPVLKALVLGMKEQLVEGEIERTKEYARKLAIGLKGQTNSAVVLPVQLGNS